ncbi:hypothetical protein D3C78_939970 [compost metagenome]
MQILKFAFELMLCHFDHVLDVYTYNFASRDKGCIALTIHNLDRFLVVIHPALQALKNRGSAAVAAAGNMKQCLITKLISNGTWVRAIGYADRRRKRLDPLQHPICRIRKFHEIHFI